MIRAGYKKHYNHNCNSLRDKKVKSLIADNLKIKCETKIEGSMINNDNVLVKGESVFYGDRRIYKDNEVNGTSTVKGISNVTGNLSTRATSFSSNETAYCNGMGSPSEQGPTRANEFIVPSFTSVRKSISWQPVYNLPTSQAIMLQNNSILSNPAVNLVIDYINVSASIQFTSEVNAIAQVLVTYTGGEQQILPTATETGFGVTSIYVQNTVPYYLQYNEVNYTFAVNTETPTNYYSVNFDVQGYKS